VNPAQASGQRVLLAAGTNTYRYGADFEKRLEDLDRVPDALRWVVETLTGLGYRVEPEAAYQHLLNPSPEQLREAVRAVAAAAPVVVIYYTGHGLKPEGDPYYLVTTETRPGLLEDTALEARQLSRLVSRKDAGGSVLPEDEQPQVLIILDCCFSGAGGLESLRESLEHMGNPKVWMLASASNLEYAQQGRFAEALKQALLDPEAGPSQLLLGLDWLADKINATLTTAEQKARYLPPGGESTGLPPFFPNPKYVPGVAGLTVIEQHWVSRLRGAPAETTPVGFYVTGRTGRVRVIEDLAGWMRDTDRGGLAVVTGSPGSGKSAMLALPVLLTDAQGQNALLAGVDPGSLLARAGDLFAGLPVLGIHARGKNPYQITDTIARHLSLCPDSPEEFLSDLDNQPQTTACTVVLDAVDEAIDPRKLLSDLLIPLARRPGLRVIIGARRHVIPPDTEASLLVDLDSDNYRDPQALADYAHQLLVATREPGVTSPYHDQDNATATVAALIADKATARPTAQGQAESFLLAQLLARAVRSRDDVLDLTRANWAEQLPASVGEAFDEDLRRLGKREPAARTLLSALAWARGAGLPWEAIWVPVAQALANLSGTGAPQLDNAHVTWLLDKAGSYIVEDLGPGGRSVFRPFHDLLAAHLRGEPPKEQNEANPAATSAWQQYRTQAEHAITRALLASVPTADDHTRDWEAAHPYLRTYLAQHAARAGLLTEIAADPGFLAAADPRILLAELDSSGERRLASVYGKAVHLLEQTTRTDERAAYLLGSAQQFGDDELCMAIQSRCTLAWQLCWTTVPPDRSRVLGRFRYPPTDSGLFAVAGTAGHPIVAAADDRTLRAWDLASAQALPPPVDLQSTPTGVAVTPDGRGIAVAVWPGWVRAKLDVDEAGRATMTRLGPTISLPPGESNIYGTLLVTRLRGQDVLVAVAVTRLYLWEFWSGELLAGPISLPGRPVGDLLVLGTSGEQRQRLLIGRSDGSLELRCLDGGDLLDQADIHDPSSVTALIRLSHPEGLYAVLCATSAGSIHRLLVHEDHLEFWPWEHEPRTDAPLWTLAAAQSPEPPLLATGGPDLRIWDGWSGRLRGSLQGHEGPIRGIALPDPNPSGDVLTYGVDGSIRQWSINDALPDLKEPDSMGAFSRGLLAGTDGQVLVLARGDGRLQFRNPDTGELDRTSTVNGQWVYGMGALDGLSRVVVGFQTGEIAIINLLEGEELGRTVSPPGWGDQDELIDLLVTSGPDPLIVAAAGNDGHLLWLHANDLQQSPPHRSLKSGVRALCLVPGTREELMVFVDREGDIWSVPVSELNDSGNWFPTLICRTANHNITAIAATLESNDLKMLTGGVDRRLEVRDRRGVVVKQMHLDSWVNDIVVSSDTVTVVTNVGVTCYYGLL
jgi:WD40 repeat protein